MAEPENVIAVAITADPKSITVAMPKLTKSDTRVKKREPKTDKARKAFDATSYSMRRSIRLVIAESIEYANAAAAKATPSTSPASSLSSAEASPTSYGMQSTRSTRSTRSMSSITMPTSPTTRTTIRTIPKTVQQVKPCPSPLVPTERKNWYRIKGIINEASRDGKTSYLIEWEGYDPSTGMDWPAEWLDSSAVSKTAIEIWRREKDEYMPDN